MKKYLYDNVVCLFEQSGTFRDAWLAADVPAVCIDINDDYGRTDHICDIFAAIDDMDHRLTMFDGIQPNTLIMAFYPCIMFCQSAMVNLHPNNPANCAMGWDRILQRVQEREKYLIRLYKLIRWCDEHECPLIIENPWTGSQYLREALPWKPYLVDHCRQQHGDYYAKPTAWWMWHIEPAGLLVESRAIYRRKISEAKRSPHPGVCSGERCEIAPEYAKNFVENLLLGRTGQINLIGYTY